MGEEKPLWKTTLTLKMHATCIAAIILALTFVQANANNVCGEDCELDGCCWTMDYGLWVMKCCDALQKVGHAEDDLDYVNGCTSDFDCTADTCCVWNDFLQDKICTGLC